MLNDPAVQFDNHFLPEGGILPFQGLRDLEVYFTTPKRYYDEIILMINKKLKTLGSQDRLHFNYIRNLELNACADKQEHTYFIAFNQGVIIGIKLLFDILLADPHVLPNVGNPGGEQDLVLDCSIFDYTRGNLISKIDGVLCLNGKYQDGMLQRPFGPLDQKRREYAINLASHALDFIFFHELAHIQNGHVDYFYGKTGRTRMQEVSQLESKISLTQQALELQADAFAGNILFGKVLDAPYLTTKDDLHMMGFAHAMLFIVFDRVRKTVADYRLNSHPHPSVREASVIAGMNTEARSRMPSKASVEQIFSSYDAGFLSAHKTTLVLSITSAMHQAMLTEYEKVIAENQRVWRQLESILHELKPYAKIP